MLKILYLLFTSFYVFYLPGYLIAKLSFRGKTRVAVFGLGLGLSCALIPIFTFAVTLILGTVFSPVCILIIATIINIPSLIALARTKQGSDSNNQK